jgi:hypothetical protein
MSNADELRAQLARAEEHEALEKSLARAKEAHREKPTDKTYAALAAAKGALRAARSEYRTTVRQDSRISAPAAHARTTAPKLEG